jgi:Trk K+ transport system NAD-binding subunit
MFSVVVGDLKKSELVIQDLKDHSYGVAFIDVHKQKDITENCLKENRIQFANLFIALTENDHVNLYLCKLAKKVYGVDKTVALANYPDNIELMEQQSIDTVLCSNLFIKNSIEDIVIRRERKCM